MTEIILIKTEQWQFFKFFETFKYY